MTPLLAAYFTPLFTHVLFPYGSLQVVAVWAVKTPGSPHGCITTNPSDVARHHDRHAARRIRRRQFVRHHNHVRAVALHGLLGNLCLCGCNASPYDEPT